MSPAQMPTLETHITLLRDMARADFDKWPEFVKRMRTMSVVPSSELPGGGLVIAASARHAIVIAPEIANEPMRALLKALSDVLKAEYDARFQTPHYARD